MKACSAVAQEEFLSSSDLASLRGLWKQTVACYTFLLLRVGAWHSPKESIGFASRSIGTGIGGSNR